MKECKYCSDSFNDESSYHQHLAKEHESELTTLEERKASEYLDDSAPIYVQDWFITSSLLGLTFIGIAYLALFGLPGSSGVSESEVKITPTGENTRHYHGTINVSILGDEVDFSKQRYQLKDSHFHFEKGNGQTWHVHSRGVTLEYALATLDIHVSKSSVIYKGTKYDDSSSKYNVTIAVNGEPVNPKEYILEKGDTVTITVEKEP